MRPRPTSQPRTGRFGASSRSARSRARLPAWSRQRFGSSGSGTLNCAAPSESTSLRTASDCCGPAPTGGLERHLLLTEPLLLVLPKDHPAREPVDLTTLREAAWIAGVTGTQFGVVLEETCRSAGFSPRILHRADDAALHRSLAEAGLGIGLLPAMACSGPEDVRFARVAGNSPRRHVSAFVRRGAARRPALAATLDALRRRAASV